MGWRRARHFASLPTTDPTGSVARAQPHLWTKQVALAHQACNGDYTTGVTTEFPLR
jgi:hypothetical protein